VEKYLNREFLKDLAERTSATYVQVFVGLELADVTNLHDVAATKAALLSALPAAFAVAKAAFKARRAAKVPAGA
jgi:flagellar basal body-associated protein FliL